MRKLLGGFLLAHAVFGAAILVPASATLAADGVTVTIPFTGTCVSPLSPASGILGFTATSSFSGGYVDAITSATRVNCIVTLVLHDPIPISATLSVTLAATTGANFLTDASGNTPTGTTLSASVSATQILEVENGTLAGKYRSEGANNSHTSWTSQLNFSSADGCYRINSTTTVVDLFAFDYSNRWVIKQDGVIIHDYGVTPNTATWSMQGAVTGLSGLHEYGFCAMNPQNNGPNYASIVMIRITQGSIGTQPALKSIITAPGDSITSYYGPEAVTNSVQGDLYQIATALGTADQFNGNPGQLLLNMPSDLAFLEFPGLNHVFMLCCGSPDYNDISAGATAAQVGARMDTMLTAIDNMSNPPTKVLVRGNFNFTVPKDPTYDTAIAVAAALHPRACYAPALSWINTVAWTGATGDRQSDQVHIHGDTGLFGYGKMAQYEETAIAAGYVLGSSFTITGPSSGTVGAASSTFTIAPTASGGIFGGQSITLSDSGAGGTFTPNLTTLTAGASSLTFTYTPASTGTKSLTATGLAQCWTAPGANSFSVGPAVPNNTNGILIGKL